jgi:hypothetical protein
LLQKFSSPYRPQTNGIVERTNRTLIAIISKLIATNKSEWDINLKLARFYYSIRPQENINMSPFQLLYGRIAKTPLIMHESEVKEYPIERIQRIQNLQKQVMKTRRDKQKKETIEIKNDYQLGDIYYTRISIGNLNLIPIGLYLMS